MVNDAQVSKWKFGPIQQSLEHVQEMCCLKPTWRAGRERTACTCLWGVSSSSVRQGQGQSPTCLAMQVKIWVHIADPCRWIRPGSLLAAEAKQRTATMYLATGKPILAQACTG